MRYLIALIIFITSFNSAQAQVKKVLFLGNSYTYVNDLPQLLKDVALSFGDTIYTDQNTPGGHQLIQHSTNATTLAKIAANNWDFVMLQEQSQKPSFSPAQVATDVYPYAKILSDSIKANYSCTETVFYMTWGRKNGDASNCATLPNICTYNGMQQRLRESYLEMADSNFATAAPVGVAWKNVRDSFPSIELYNPDESHPSIYGSYLAACVFYATLYQKPATGSTYIPSGISASDALILQTVASTTVLDSLSLWRVNANQPIANYNYSGGTTINFTSTSTNGVTYFWDFGDGNTSSLENPTNAYSSNNTYPVQLIVFSNDSCFSDTITQNIIVSPTGIDSFNKNTTVNIYPNPSSRFIVIGTTLDFHTLTIIDVTGQVKATYSDKNQPINISALANGIYFIRLVGENTSVIQKFIKQ